MKRNTLEQLIKWKLDPERKPLIIRGARQVGKTWLMLEFGSKYYDQYVYLNFEKQPDIKSIFELNKDPHRILELIGLISGKKIIPQSTLLILDEIQECPNALNALKYFNEEANEYHLIVAGSLLGTFLAQQYSYPVGKVNIINIYPLTFDEWLEETDSNLFSYYKSINKRESIPLIFHNKLLESYKQYLVVGGMPECVLSWVTNKDPDKIVKIQRELIIIYENDFSKYNNQIDAARLLMLFRSIVPQLAKNNPKFIYGVLKSGARAREYEAVIEWLVSAGLVNRVNNVSNPIYPLYAYKIANYFKLYFFDTGLLNFMAGITAESIILDREFAFKGVIVENYVLQQIKAKSDSEPYFYAVPQSLEIDYIIQHKGEILPIEVKAGADKKATSIKTFLQKNSSIRAIRFSQMNYQIEDKLTNIPLYLCPKIYELI